MLTAIMPAYSIDLQRIPFADVSIRTANIPRWEVAVPAGELGTLQEAVCKPKERFGFASSSQVLICNEAGRDGFW